MEVKNLDQIHEFQKWASKRNYSWTGACDVWLGAWEYYNVSELVRIKKLYDEEIERTQQLLVANGNMRLLLSENGIDHEN